MIDFMRIGGFNMWFLSILGVLMVGTAIRFAALADPQRLAILRALTFAIITCAVTGFFSGAIRCLLSVSHAPGPSDERFLLIAAGLGESCANLVLGGAFVAVTWILIAVGVRRMPLDPA